MRNCIVCCLTNCLHNDAFKPLKGLRNVGWFEKFKLKSDLLNFKLIKIRLFRGMKCPVHHVNSKLPDVFYDTTLLELWRECRRCSIERFVLKELNLWYRKDLIYNNDWQAGRGWSLSQEYLRVLNCFESVFYLLDRV